MKNKSTKLFFAVVALFAIQFVYSASLTSETEVSASSTLFPTCSSYLDCKGEYNGSRYYFPCINNQCAALSCNSGNVSECGTYGDTSSDKCINGAFTVNGNPAVTGKMCVKGPFVLATPTPVVTAAPTPSPTTVQSVSLPAAFSKTGSTTTDLKKIPTTEASKYKGLTFDDPTTSSIKFPGAIDLTNQNLLNDLKQLDKFMKLSKGVVSIDTTAISELKNIPATITMYGLTDLDPENIVILRDGKQAGAEYVGGINYNEDTDLLTFNVTGFSEYKVDLVASALEEEVITPTPTTIVTTTNNSNDSRLPLVIGLAFVAVAIVAVFFALKKKGMTSKVDTKNSNLSVPTVNTVETSI